MEERIRLVVKLVLLILGTILIVWLTVGFVLARFVWGLWVALLLGVLVLAAYIAYIITDYTRALHKRRRQVGEEGDGF